MINVGIDINAMHPASAGIGRYVHNLLRAMNNVDTAGFSFSLLAGLKTRIDFPLKDNFEINNHFRLIKSGLLRANLLLPLEMSINKYDIFHGLYPNAIPLYNRNSRIILTVHDLIPILFPQYCTKKQYRITSNFLRRGIRHCDGLIADSENTKRDICSVFNYPADRIKVIYLSYEPDRFFLISDENKKNTVRKKFGLDSDFLLFTSTLEPRKNIPLLLEVLSEIIKQKEHRKLKLVIVGQLGWLWQKIFDTIKNKDLSKNVVFTGFINDDELNVLYNTAKVFVYPSKYEGFGLPIVEAMACGCPAVTTNVSSIPEIAADAAIMVHPEDGEGLKQGIVKLLEDEDEHRRYSLAGLERVKMFGWDKAANATIAFYNSLMRDKK